MNFFNNVGLRLKVFSFIILLLFAIPGLILFSFFFEDKSGFAFVSLLSFTALGLFFSTLLEAIGEIVIRCQQIAENTDPNKKTIVAKKVKYRCKKCGNIIDSLPCPICNKPTPENHATVIDDVLCANCGADISNDTNTCHVCGKKI